MNVHTLKGEIPVRQRYPVKDLRYKAVEREDKLVITFPNKESLENFLGWLSDGGGEWSYMESDTTINHFDYGRAFETWGYDPKAGYPAVDLYSMEEEDEDEFTSGEGVYE